MPEDAKIVRFGDNAATITAYVSGQVDVLVTGITVAAKVAAENPKLVMKTKFIIKDSPAFIGIKAGEMNAMSEKWFGQALPALPVL